jgi:hypothetical protein
MEEIPLILQYPEYSDSLINIFFRMHCHHRCPDPGAAVGDRGRPDGGGENALGKSLLRGLKCLV